MISPSLITPKPNSSSIYVFKRRERLPSQANALWYIADGAARTYTMMEDGTVITLGFWGVGDVVGQPLGCIQPYEVECLTDVQVRMLQWDQSWSLSQLLLPHLHQTQVLLRVCTGQISQRLQQLLDWLVYKFGCASEQGQLIQLRLTHQDFADTLGTTRVTVTRLLNRFEQEGRIQWVKHHLLIP
jgi:CRP-like cAMP-binding protein